MEHEQPTGKAIVLVHGLSDSPYFLTAIGNYFFEVLGYNVYLPLLHCHGLKEPNGMEDVDIEEWKANVNFAIDTAEKKPSRFRSADYPALTWMGQENCPSRSIELMLSSKDLIFKSLLLSGFLRHIPRVIPLLILQASKISKKYRFPTYSPYFRIPQSVGVSHASLVLKDPILAIDAASTDKPLEKANPWFPQVIEAIADIELDRVAKTSV